MLQSHFMAFVNLRGRSADEPTIVSYKSMAVSRNKQEGHIFMCRRHVQPRGK